MVYTTILLHALPLRVKFIAISMKLDPVSTSLIRVFSIGKLTPKREIKTNTEHLLMLEQS